MEVHVISIITEIILGGYKIIIKNWVSRIISLNNELIKTYSRVYDEIKMSEKDNANAIVITKIKNWN